MFSLDFIEKTLVRGRSEGRTIEETMAELRRAAEEPTWSAGTTFHDIRGFYVLYLAAPAAFVITDGRNLAKIEGTTYHGTREAAQAALDRAGSRVGILGSVRTAAGWAGVLVGVR